mgnify:CR=1 FL=1
MSFTEFGEGEDENEDLDRLMKYNSDTVDVSDPDDQNEGGGSVTNETHAPPGYDAYGF